MNSKLISNSKLASISTLFLVLGLNLVVANKAQSLELTLSPINSGWVGQNGLRFQGNTNYFAGDCRGAIGKCGQPDNINPGEEVRNFFSFDTTGYSFNNINSAKLRLQLPEFNVINDVNDPNYPVGSTVSGFVSVDGMEDFQLFDVTNSNIPLLNSGYAAGDLTGQSLFNDLGTGSSISDVVTIDNTSADPDDAFDFVEINLNQAGISQILSNGQFAFGGAISSLDNNVNDEFAFAYTNPAFNALNPNAVDVLNRIQLVIDADEVEISAERRGFVSETGLNFGNTNYAAGDCRGAIGECQNFGVDIGDSVRNFFVFNLEDISALSNSGVTASLKLGIPGQFNYTINGETKTGIGFFTDSPVDTESYALFDVQTAISDLIATRPTPNTTGQNIFTDLGQGDNYSDEQEITLADIGNFKEIPLNQTFGNDLINALALGDQLAIGGAVTTLNNDTGFDADDEMVFGFSNDAFENVGANPVGAFLVLKDASNGGGFSLSPIQLLSGPAESSTLTEWTGVASVLGLSDQPSSFFINEASASLDDSSIDVDALSSAIGVNNSQSTPEPSALIGLIGLGCFGLFGRKKDK